MKLILSNVDLICSSQSFAAFLSLHDKNNERVPRRCWWLGMDRGGHERLSPPNESHPLQLRKSPKLH